MKRWTLEDDTFLHAYADAGADYIAMHDLGRSSKTAGSGRVRHLKKTGAWDALSDIKAAQARYHAALGHARFEDGET